MVPEQLNLFLPKLRGPAPEAPHLARGYASCGTLAYRFHDSMKQMNARLRQVADGNISSDGQVVSGSSYVAAALGIHCALSAQMDYRIVDTVRQTPTETRDTIAASVAANCSASLILIESTSDEVRAECDQILSDAGIAGRSSKHGVGRSRIRIGEQLLISFEMLRREIEGLASLVGRSVKGASGDMDPRKG